MGAGLRERWRHLRQRLRGGSFFAQVAVLVGGAAFAQALGVAAMPVLTRLYTPGDYGVFAVYASLLAILAAINSLRYELAVSLPKDEEDGASLLALVLALVVTLSAILGGTAWVLREQIAAWTKTPDLARYMWLLPLGLVLLGIYRGLTYWAIRRQAFGHIARTRVNQGIASVVVQIGMGLLQLRPLGLLVGSIVGQSSGSGTLAALAWRQDREALKSVSWRNLRRVAWRYRRFPLFSGSVLLNIVGTRLPSLLIASAFGADIVGGFALVMRVLGWPMQFIGAAVGQVYIGEASRLVREDPTKQYALIVRTTRRLALMGLSILVIGLLAPMVFAFVFGDRWREAGVYCQVLAPMIFAQFVVSPISNLTNVVERQDLQLYGDAARAIIVVAVFVGAARAQWGAVPALALYSGAMTLTYIAFFAMYVAIARAASPKATLASGGPVA